MFTDRFQITLASRSHMPNEQFKKEILRAAQDMRDLFESEESGKT